MKSILSYPHAFPAVFTDNLHAGDAVFRPDYKIRLKISGCGEIFAVFSSSAITRALPNIYVEFGYILLNSSKFVWKVTSEK